MSPIRFRKRVRLGPIHWNFTERGYSSWSFKLGPFSWNSRTRRHSVDLPGPFRWISARRKA
jgi:hypothetical protein